MDKKTILTIKSIKIPLSSITRWDDETPNIFKRLIEKSAMTAINILKKIIWMDPPPNK